MYKNTPWHIAAKNGHFLIVKFLLENGAIPTSTNHEGKTSFNFADETRRAIESKPGTTRAVLDNYDAIRKLLVKAQEGK